MAVHRWLATLGVALIGLSAPAPTGALESAKITSVTFGRSVALPGVTLGPGTYVFELADPVGAWDLVRVSSRDRRVVYLTTFTRVVDRPSDLNPAQTFSFREAAAGSPQPIHTWWISGQPTGRQFIYE